MSKINFLYVSDFFLSDIVGGGELNDHELCSILSPVKIRSHKLTLSLLKKYKDHKVIVSNFINLGEPMKEELINNFSYIIYEHDHKYLRSRNPSMYNDFIAPKTEIVNEEFYSNAKVVLCQSSFHRQIIEKNLKNVTLKNISGNLWSPEILKTLERLSKKTKNDRVSIMMSNILHKNTREAKFYCDSKGLKYDLIASKDYIEFLNLLSNNNRFMFLPKTPETLSRVVVEARMMEVKTITNKNVGACYEDWFSLKGKDLINYIQKKRIEIPKIIREVM